jgi:hypothetical protein
MMTFGKTTIMLGDKEIRQCGIGTIKVVAEYGGRKGREGEDGRCSYLCDGKTIEVPPGGCVFCHGVALCCD